MTTPGSNLGYDVGPCNFNSVASVLRFLLLIVSLAGPLQGADAAETVRIMALGDSLTAGFGLAAADSFPVQLEAALKAAVGEARSDWPEITVAQTAQLLLSVYSGLRVMTRARIERGRLEGAKEAGLAVLAG